MGWRLALMAGSPVMIPVAAGGGRDLRNRYSHSVVGALAGRGMTVPYSMEISDFMIMAALETWDRGQ